MNPFWFVLILASPLSEASSPLCASRYSDLEKSETLKVWQQVLPAKGLKGFVNGTRGSYFFIKSTEDKFEMTFLTTGLFDLYGIRREGVIQFCESAGRVLVVGMGYEEEITLTSGVIQLGGGTPRQTFQEGPVPPLLEQKHNLESLRFISDDDP